MSNTASTDFRTINYVNVLFMFFFLYHFHDCEFFFPYLFHNVHLDKQKQTFENFEKDYLCWQTSECECECDGPDSVVILILFF